MATRTSAQLRKAIVAYWLWGIAHEPQIHYAQQRPMEDVRNPSKLKTLPRTADCSEFVTDGYAYAGAPDPNHGPDEHQYDGQGYTGTLLQHGTKIKVSDALPGDIVIFGSYPGEHACGVLEAGADPLLASHGTERGPVAIRLSVEKTYHAGQAVIFLRALPNSPEPPAVGESDKYNKAKLKLTPPDVLRAKKGIWSWIHWCEADQMWAGYQVKSPICRPNVPEKIPKRWYVVRAAYVARKALKK